MAGRAVLAFLVLALLVAWSGPSAARDLEQLVSREDPAFQPAPSRLAVGLDGRVYLSNRSGYVLRVERDGSSRSGKTLGDHVTAATADAAGVMGVGLAHFQHAVGLWDPRFVKLGAVNDFLVNDQVQFSAPSAVEAGPSGDFYGLDHNRARIVRVSAAGKTVGTFSLAKLGEDLTRKWAQLRVWEAGRRFYLLCPSGKLRVIGFDGEPAWSVPGIVEGSPDDGWRGGFDVDAQGRLLILADASDTIQILGPDGKPAGQLRLATRQAKGRVSDLRAFQGQLFVRGPSPTELFQVYDRKTGALERVVTAAHERLTVSLGTEVWTAGQPVPLAIRLDGSSAPPPRWRIGLRALGSIAMEALTLAEGRITPPAGAGGLYQLRVESGDYRIDTVVEVRAPGAKGSVSLLTPLNRVYFGQGEAIPLTLLARGEGVPGVLPVHLVAEGSLVVAQEDVRLRDGQAQLTLRPELTASLRPGRYRIVAMAPGVTVASQEIVIGPGLPAAPAFTLVQYGDYRSGFPSATLFDSAERVAAHVERAGKLGINMFVDRLGQGGAGVMSRLDETFAATDWLARARKDKEENPASPAREKATLEGGARQAIAAYGAQGIEERAILLAMDAKLPVGTGGQETRKTEQLLQAVTHVNDTLASYAAFRGWSWAANWWPEKAVAASEDVARAEHLFNAVSKRGAPRVLSAATGPYRSLGVIPPVAFRHADEVDLQYQAEQIQPPGVTPHNVDFYARPGKRAWGHPEVSNDDGTGAMIAPSLLQMAARGADGVGWSADAAQPHGVPIVDDPRTGGPGVLSVHRALAHLFRDYGPWMTHLRGNDHVAILVSSAMMRRDTWGKVGGVYFGHLFEAYGACLAAHRPASFVFAEDVTPETLRRFAAVLVVGQQVELEAGLARALAAAQAAGTPVFRDLITRAELAPGAVSLEVAFDRIEKDPSAWQDDSAWQRIPAYLEAGARLLEKKLQAVPAVAEVSRPGIMLSERVSGQGRFVWVVPTQGTGLDPARAWRVGLMISQRLPVVVPLTLPGTAGAAIYDVLALRKVEAADGKVVADLRTAPARLFAVLPRPIAAVTLSGPRLVAGGREFSWSASVQDDGGRLVPSSLPLRVWLEGPDGRVLREEAVATRPDGPAEGRWTMPLNVGVGQARLRVAELVSGKAADLAVTVAAPATPALLSGGPRPVPRPMTDWLPQRARGARGDTTPLEERFGPHLKDVAVSEEQGVALVSAMAWDHNLYALDLASGKVTWRQRVGHHFAYQPQRAGGLFAVQGFDLEAPEGYHLYLLDRGGRPQRRFALYGLPQRATGWFLASTRRDRIANLVASPGGDWVASAGDLGLAVWDREGKSLFHTDAWKTGREQTLLLAPDALTLVTLQGTTAVARDPRSGRERWRVEVASSGSVLGGAASADGQTLALRADTLGGRVFVLRQGRVLATLPARSPEDVTVSPDGAVIAVTSGKELQVHRATGGLLWSFSGDEWLRHPRIAADGRIAVGSDLGTLYVLGKGGELERQIDCEGLPVPTWLRGGDLLVATWNGVALRLDARYAERWRVRLQPVETDIRPRLLEKDPTPTTRMEGWGNAAPQPLPLSPNLLAAAKVKVVAMLGTRAQAWERPITALFDGRPDAPAEPWVGWTWINYVESGWRDSFALEMDASPASLKVTAVTLVEDPAHPESWVRDARLEWWDGKREAWVPGPYLLSNAATHSHVLPRALESTRFRLVSSGGPGWPVGNLRLGELVLHGQVVGAAPPRM